MLDIDHFKRYNDLYGHPVGDDCLRRIAGALRDSLRQSGDMVARFGGEEFAVILPRTPINGGMVVGEAIRKSIASRELKRKSTGENFGSITVSVGVAVLRPSEPMEGTLVVTCTAAGSVPDELPPEDPEACAPAPEPPPPQAASETISSSASIAAISRDIRLDSIRGVMRRFSAEMSGVGMACRVMADGPQRAAAATSLTTRGVRKTSSSVRSLRRWLFLKALPMIGRSPSNGTLLTRLRSICS
jgi:hypothetical protein